MRIFRVASVLAIAVMLAVAGCTTPYRPRVVVHGSAPFPGIAGLIEQDTSKQVDVLLVHGMCTHTRADAKTAIDKGHRPSAPRVRIGLDGFPIWD